MIVGNVHGRQALVNVTFDVPAGPDIQIEFVVDTGFEGALTLPVAAISALGLPFYQELFANLADDSSIRVDVFRATILWDGTRRDVAVLATGKRPLLGTALLDGHHLDVDFWNGGAVQIQAPASREGGS